MKYFFINLILNIFFVLPDWFLERFFPKKGAFIRNKHLDRQSRIFLKLIGIFGYKPNVTTLATTDIDFYQIVPSKVSASQYVPDYDYALYVNANTQISTRAGTPTTFTIEDPVDFSVSSSNSPTEVSIAQITSGNPSQYLLKKTIKGF